MSVVYKKKIFSIALFFATIGIAFCIATPQAFAMSSKGNAKVAFHTDANTYSKKATTIVVTGKCITSPISGTVVELYKKGNPNSIKRIDIWKGSTYTVSFKLKGLSSGLYDVKVASGWADRDYRAELKHYLKVTR